MEQRYDIDSIVVFCRQTRYIFTLPALWATECPEIPPKLMSRFMPWLHRHFLNSMYIVKRSK